MSDEHDDSRRQAERITGEVTSWPGVEAGHGGGASSRSRVGRREIGHLHGDHAAHFFFPKEVWLELERQGRIAPHPMFPGRKGPASRGIGDELDVEDVIAMMRLNYDRVVALGHPPRDAAA